MPTPLSNIAEGTVLVVDGGANGLTRMEREAQQGTLDLAKYQRIIPPDQLEAIKSRLDARTANTVAEMSTMKQEIAKPKSLAELTPTERGRVMEQLRNLEGKLPTQDISAGLQKSGEDFFVDPTSIPSMYDVDDESTKVDPYADIHYQPTLPPVLTLPTATAVPFQEVVKDTETLAQPSVCPNCAWHYNTPVIAVTDEDKRNWLRAILGAQRFHKTYQLFGGKLSVTFRTRSMTEIDMVANQLIIEHEDGRIPRAPAQLCLAAHNNRMRKLDMAASLVNVTGMTYKLPTMDSKEAIEFFKSFTPLKSNDTLPAIAHDALCGKWTEALYGTLFKQFTIFDDLCFQLKEAAASPDFWKETGGRS